MDAGGRQRREQVVEKTGWAVIENCSCIFDISVATKPRIQTYDNKLPAKHQTSIKLSR